MVGFPDKDRRASCIRVRDGDESIDPSPADEIEGGVVNEDQARTENFLEEIKLV